MESTPSRTSLPNSSNLDSGIGVNSFASSTSQIAPEQIVHEVVQDIPAPSEARANGGLIEAVQEAGDNEGDVYVNPTGRVVFRSFGERIITICYGDIDIQMAKAQQEIFRHLLLAIERCWTCFACRRAVINYPCMCFGNCQDCAQVMSVCSLCYSRIELAIPVVFQYVG